MATLFANNASSSVALGIISPEATQIELVNAAAFPSPSNGDVFYLTLTQSRPSLETSWEIVKCTARTGNVLTVVRAQEGTIALTWPIGSKAEMRLTAGQVAGFQASTGFSFTLEGTPGATYTLPVGTNSLPKNDQQFYLGTTPLNINRASGVQSLTGITSIDGNSASVTITPSLEDLSYYLLASPSASGTTQPRTVTGVRVNPLNGNISATAFTGSGAGLTNLPGSQLSGTIPSAVLGNSSTYIGTTQIPLNRTSGEMTLTGISSIDGSTVGIGTSVATAVSIGTGSSTQTINIGTGSGSTTINIGGPGDTVNIAGSLNYIQTTNLEVTDKVITLNKGGAASSGAASGIEVEEDKSSVAAILLGNVRDAWVMRVPTKGGTMSFSPSSSPFEGKIISTATANREISLPDKTGTLALVSDFDTFAGNTAINTLGTITTGVWAGTPIDAQYIGALRESLYDGTLDISGATTASISRHHLCSGTTTDYVVTLPPLSGNEGRKISFAMAPGLTKLVTIKGNGSELISGKNTRVMWANETCVLRANDDGSGWIKVGGQTIPMSATLRLAAPQLFSANTNTLLNYTDLVTSNCPAAFVDAANKKIIICRENPIQFDINAGYNNTNTSPTFVSVFLSKNGLGGFDLYGFTSYVASNYSLAHTSGLLRPSIGDYYQPFGLFGAGTFSTATISRFSVTNCSFINAVEVPEW